jgi:hypothetical protein
VARAGGGDDLSRGFSDLEERRSSIFSKSNITSFLHEPRVWRDSKATPLKHKIWGFFDLEIILNGPHTRNFWPGTYVFVTTNDK